MSKLPHVIWDMGGIIYPFFTELMIDLGLERGWPLERIPLGPTGLVPDPDYERLLDGDFDEGEYLEIIRRRLRAEGIEYDPVAEMAGTWVWRPETREAVDSIERRGHRQALLTNDATRWLGEAWWETWGGPDAFEAIVDVAQIGVPKPAPEPYLATAEALGEPARDCLFIDDRRANCRGAEEVGMASHLFDITDPKGSVDSLLERLDAF